jgi:transketolase
MQANEKDLQFLSRKAWELREEVVEMIYCSEGKSGHFGGSLSAAEIVTILYWKALKIRPEEPEWEGRDRFVLSKGHSVPIVYAALAHRGFFDRSLLRTFRRDGSVLQGHPDCLKTPGLDTSSGSLGQGLSVALGMALGARHAPSMFSVYCLLSDGEHDEGMTWEAVMAASHFRVTNLTVLVDYNKLQCDGRPHDIMEIEPVVDKWKAFGWRTIEADGHSIPSLLSALEARSQITDTPCVIICHTVKGKGVSFMEDSVEWHCRPISEEQKNKAVGEIEGMIAKHGGNT